MNILVAGDYCPRERVAALLLKDDFETVFADVRNIIEQVDYSILNFECPVVDADLKPIEKIGPNLKCSQKAVMALKYAGFDCVTLANNHFRDYGNEGVKNTLSALDALKIKHVGGGKNIFEASQTLYEEISGQKLAIINCCEHEFSIATENKAGSNPLNPIRQYYDIKEAKNNADYVLVIIHGGHEHFQLPSPRMVDTYRFLVDSGADAVVNHHQHCFSGYEVYKGKPIFYGIGNFCFDRTEKKNRLWNEGYSVLLDFSKKAVMFRLQPYLQCYSEPIIKMLSNDAFDKRIGELNDVITNRQKLIESTSLYYDKCETECSNVFEPLRNRLYFGAKRRGWLPSLIGKERKLTITDYILCESHRDKLMHWLEVNE